MVSKRDEVWVGIILVLLLQLRMSDECWEEERVALLGLRSFFGNSPTLDWLREDSFRTSDCCLWEGVVCSNSTGRIVKLNLHFASEYCGDYGFYYGDSEFCYCPGDGYFNASLLLPFQQLNSLSLSCNGISHWVDPEGIEGQSAMFSQLEVLDLSFNNFDSSLMSSLGEFSSLKSLTLKGSDWFLEFGFNFSDFGRLSTKLRHLQVLDLSFSYIVDSNLSSLSGFFSLKSLNLNNLLSFSWRQINAFEDLPYFKNLEYLRLDALPLNPPSLQSIGLMKSLRTLSLNGCGLGGTLPPAQGLCDLIHLQELDVSNNDLSGSLPWCLGNLTSLQKLDLSGNHFTGNTSVSSLGSLTSIYYLQLSNNHLQIPISLEPFLNLSKLKYVDVSSNEIYTERESHSLTPKFQLETLILSGQGYGGTIPEFLYYQHELQHVVIKNIKMEGEFPNWLLDNNPALEQLFFVNLSLSGPFRLPKISLIHLSHLDVSENSLLGYIPSEIGAYMPNIKYLNISANGFNGSIPISISEMNLLQTLDLSDNQLSGKLSQEFSMGLSSLRTLILSNNSLEGRILSSKSNWLNMTWLKLDKNQFCGGIPDWLRNCSYLQLLDISSNHLNGEIPEWMGNMLHLEVLDLSDNNLTGSLPVGFSPPGIFHVHLFQNGLQGSLKDTFSNSSTLTTLDLSHNRFSGTISNWLSSPCNKLTYLLLNNNDLEGGIPVQFCKFTKLRLFDLSHNKFSGHIFPCLNDQKWDEATSAFAPLISIAPTDSNSVVMEPAPALSSSIQQQEPLQFTTKRRSEPYRGRILEYMSGIDLSCNRLNGKIPPGIGSLRKLKSLNLSHNSLTGSIPPTLSNLSEIESLDLSSNNLSGKIPPQLTQLYSLAVFNVSYNNLSGNTPQRISQFATFENDSYYGNPLLCGSPLSRSCNTTEPSMPIPEYEEREEDSGFIDLEVFYVSFLVTYVCFLLGIAAVLYINPRWRRVWFYHIHRGIDFWHYFMVDSLTKLSRFRIKYPRLMLS